MFSLFVFILLLNGVLALPSLVRIKEPIDLKPRQQIIQETYIVPMNCTTFNFNKINCVVTVGIGTPPHYYHLLVDTASSNTWVGARAHNPFIPTSSTVETGRTVAKFYAAGSFSGKEVNDTLILGPNIFIKSQSIGVAQQSTGFEGVDGVLGIGPKDLTRGSLISNASGVIPTVVDQMKAQGIIKSAIFGIFIPPAGKPKSVVGELMFGGTDATKVSGNLPLFPVSTSTVANLIAGDFWALDVDMTLGSNSILSNSPISMDMGTSTFQLASDAYQRYKEATGATVDPATGILKVTHDQFASLPDLVIHVLGTNISLPSSAQRSEFTDGSRDVFLTATSLSTNTNQSFGAVFGVVMLSQLYTAYDADGLVGIDLSK